MVVALANMKNTKAVVMNYNLWLLTHLELSRQNCVILSEVVLYMEGSKNHEKNYIITVLKKITFLRTFDRKNTVLQYQEILSTSLFSNDSKCKKIMC